MAPMKNYSFKRRAPGEQTAMTNRKAFQSSEGGGVMGKAAGREVSQKQDEALQTHTLEMLRKSES